MTAKPDQIERILNQSQSLLEGLRSTWLRRDIDGMIDDAEALSVAMKQLIEACRL